MIAPYLIQRGANDHGREGRTPRIEAFPSARLPGSTGHGYGRTWIDTPENRLEALAYIESVLAGMPSQQRVVTRAPTPSRSDFDDLNDPKAREVLIEAGVRVYRALQAEMRVEAEATGLFGPGDELAPRGKDRKALIGDIYTAFKNGGHHVFIREGMQRSEYVQDAADDFHIELVVL